MKNKITFLMNVDHGLFPGWKMEERLGKMTSWEERTSPKVFAYVRDRWKEIADIIDKSKEQFYDIYRYPGINSDLGCYAKLAFVRAELYLDFETYDGKEDEPKIRLIEQEWTRFDAYQEDRSVLDFLEDRDEE